MEDLPASRVWLTEGTAFFAGTFRKPIWTFPTDKNTTPSFLHGVPVKCSVVNWKTEMRSQNRTHPSCKGWCDFLDESWMRIPVRKWIGTTKLCPSSVWNNPIKYTPDIRCYITLLHSVCYIKLSKSVNVFPHVANILTPSSQKQHTPLTTWFTPHLFSNLFTWFLRTW